jgi:GTP-binding protein EngB required for normal cell division
MALSKPLIFVVVGETGDGKSSLIKEVCPPGRSVPVVGMNPRGVTKTCQFYDALIGGRQCRLIDTPGVGDDTIKVARLKDLLQKVIQDGTVNGIIMCCAIHKNRVTQGAHIMSMMMQLCTQGGIKKWENVIFVGTQKDRCSTAEIKNFRTNTLQLLNDNITQVDPTQPGNVTKVACVNVAVTPNVRADLSELVAVIRSLDSTVIQHKPVDGVALGESTCRKLEVPPPTVTTTRVVEHITVRRDSSCTVL